jgi:hypothetical protein
LHRKCLTVNFLSYDIESAKKKVHLFYVYLLRVFRTLKVKTAHSSDILSRSALGLISSYRADEGYDMKNDML